MFRAVFVGVVLISIRMIRRSMIIYVVIRLMCVLRIGVLLLVLLLLCGL